MAKYRYCEYGICLYIVSYRYRHISPSNMDGSCHSNKYDCICQQDGLLYPCRSDSTTSHIRMQSESRQGIARVHLLPSDTQILYLPIDVFKFFEKIQIYFSNMKDENLPVIVILISFVPLAYSQYTEFSMMRQFANHQLSPLPSHFKVQVCPTVKRHSVLYTLLAVEAMYPVDLQLDCNRLHEITVLSSTP